MLVARDVTLTLHQARAGNSILKDELVLVRANFDANFDDNAKENSRQLADEPGEEAGYKATDWLLDVVGDHNLTLGMVYKDCYRQQIWLRGRPKLKQ